MDCAQATGRTRKRKADNQDNERLSKRLSLLNLERNGQKLYVPVERPTTPTNTSTKPKSPLRPAHAQDDDVMHLDDTKHKVYIYDLDAELSDSESSDDGKLIFLPDIQKHLRETRIPPSVMANSEGELAGQKQLVLYSVPSSLSVPEEKDSVRKAIIEARARARTKAEEDHKRTQTYQLGGSPDRVPEARDRYHGMNNGISGTPGLINGTGTSGNSTSNVSSPGRMSGITTAPMEDTSMDDPDAMDLG